MHRLINVIKNVFKSDIVCPCGYKTTSRKQAVKHLASHNDGLGTIEYSTGLILW